jgi:hypothetical protein
MGRTLYPVEEIFEKAREAEKKRIVQQIGEEGTQNMSSHTE